MGVPLEDTLTRATRLADCEYLRIDLFLPASCGNPLGALRALMDEDGIPLPEGYKTELDYWRTWQEEFSRARLDERDRLLREGEEHFTQATGLPSRREAGRFYSDRAIYNDEAIGNIAEFRIGDGWRPRYLHN